MGSTDELKYKVLTSADLPEVTQLMEQHFLPRNPLARATKETRNKDFGGQLDTDMEQCVRSGVSVGVWASGALVGFRLSLVLTKEGGGEEEPPYSKSYKVLEQLSAGVDLYKTENVNKILKMFAVTVHPDYCGRGIAGVLVKKTIALGEEQGCQLVTTDITNTVAGKIFTRLGFREVNTLDLTTVEGLDLSIIPGETLFKLMVANLPLNSSKDKGTDLTQRQN